MNTPKPGGNDIINLSPDHMVDHPAGAHYVLWNGSDFLDVGVPAGGLSDADYAAALQKHSATRYQCLMDAAWGIGGWSTYRPR